MSIETDLVSMGFFREAPQFFVSQKNMTLVKTAPGRPLGSRAIERKTQISIRLDANLVAGLKAMGRGWQTRLNTTLVAFASNGQLDLTGEIEREFSDLRRSNRELTAQNEGLLRISSDYVNRCHDLEENNCRLIDQYRAATRDRQVGTRACQIVNQLKLDLDACSSRLQTTTYVGSRHPGTKAELASAAAQLRSLAETLSPSGERQPAKKNDNTAALK